MSIPIERCAEMRAEMDAGRLRDEVLAREGVSGDEWTVTQREWLEKMGAELQVGRYELTNCYSKAFLKRQREIGAQAVAPSPTAGMSPSDTPALAPEGPIAGLPSQVLATPASATAGPLPHAPSPWAAAPDVGIATEPPGASPLRPAPAITKGPTPARAPLAATSLGFVVPLGPALPFAQGATATPPGPPAKASPVSPQSASTTAPSPSSATGATASPPMPAVKRAPAALSGTSLGFVAPKGPALPFAPGTPSPPPPPPPAAESAGAPPAPLPGVKRPPAALSGTSLGFVAPKGPALPFAPRASAGPRPAAPGTAGADGGNTDTGDIPAPELERDASAPGPIAPLLQPEVPPGHAAAERAGGDRLEPAAPSLAGASAVPAAAPALTLQQYASLCAELAVFRDRTDAIFQRYGLADPRDRAAVDLSWKERLRRIPAENQGWQALYQRWVEHFERQMNAGGGS